jgi:hypothetical protein
MPSFHREASSVISLQDRLAAAQGEDQQTKPLPEVDLTGDWVKKIMHDRLWAHIYGADEEETGIPKLECEL